MNNKLFYFSLIILIVLTLTLSLQIATVITHHTLSVLFFSQFTNLIAGYLMLGIGVGLPMVLLASTLSWLQILLLLGGQVDPHLGREGIVKVVKTLLNKF